MLFPRPHRFEKSRDRIIRVDALEMIPKRSLALDLDDAQLTIQRANDSAAKWRIIAIGLGSILAGQLINLMLSLI